MAKRPNIDTGQLEKADKIMSDIVSKFDTLARLDELPIFKLLPEQLDDVDQRLQSVNKAVKLLSKGAQKDWKQFTGAIKQNRKEFESLDKSIRHKLALQQRGVRLTRRETEEMELQREQMVQLDRELREQLNVRRAFMKLGAKEGAKFLDWFGGSVVSMSFSTVFAGMKLLATGIEKIYDLQEKWTQAIGMFRKQIGPASKDTKSFEKVAADLHFPLEALGMDFAAAHQEVASFVEGFGFANKAAADWAKQAVQFGIVTGAGSQAIGELSRAMMIMGDQQKDQKGFFTDMIASANAAGVSVSAFSKEVASSKDFLSEFGATGKKMFLNAAAWARKLGVSIKSLQNIMKLTDTFESAATAAAKMNTVFGTSINSLDLMLEDDPAKRFNMIRDQMIGVGKDMKNLTRLETKLMADTLGMSIEETQAFLKSGQDYNKFMEEKAKADEEAAKNTANMNKFMGKASTTLLNWSMIAEQIIGKLQPLIQAFLTGMGGGFENVANGAKTFSDMLLKGVDEIIGVLGGPDGVTETLKGMGKAFRGILGEIFDPKNIKSVVTGLSDIFNKFGRLVTWITDLSASPAIKLLSWIIEKLGSWGHVIAGAWAGAKAGAAVGSLFGGIGAVPGAVAGAIIGGAGASIAGKALSDSQYDNDASVEQEANERVANSGGSLDYNEARAQVINERRNAGTAPAPASAAPVTTEPGRQPMTVTPGPSSSAAPAASPARTAVASNNRGSYLPVTLNVNLHLDSRRLQGMAFDTSLPVNVSVAGG